MPVQFNGVNFGNIVEAVGKLIDENRDLKHRVLALERGTQTTKRN